MEEKQWRILYRTAVLESDREKLQSSVKAAEDAMNEHVASLNGDIPWEERIEMGNALSALWALKRHWARSTILERRPDRDARRSK